MIKKINMTALVTGANRGIGASIANKLYFEGYKVFGTSTSGKGNTFGVYEWLQGDFASHEGIEDFLIKLNSFDSFNVLVNNAGINIIKSSNNVSEKDFVKIQNINFKAPYFITKNVIEKMIVNKYGRVVNLASIWSVISKPERSLYSAMKTGLLGITRSLAVEHSINNVLINSVSPGFVETNLTKESMSHEQIEKIKKQIPMKRLAQPKEISELVAFLCSEKNTYLTGQNIVIDGGFTII